MICYTDGACSGNPGPGGFGIIILDDNENFITSYSKHDPNTTNNRCELKAILWVLLTYGKEPIPPKVFSDSAYAVNTLNQWCWRWAKNGWIKSDNKKPENLDLIQTYYEYWNKGYRINLQKCQGHTGLDDWNSKADKLAVKAKQIK